MAEKLVERATDNGATVAGRSLFVAVKTVELLNLLLCTLDAFEVANGADTELRSRVLIGNEQSIRMKLNARNGVHMVDAFLDTLCQRVCFVLSNDDDQDLPCIHDGLYTDGESHAGDFERVVVEEPRIVQDGIVGQSLDTRARSERRTRLVEGNVTVRTDTSHEKIDTTHFLDLGLVLVALGHEIRRVAVENVNVLRLNVDVAEKVVPHERVVRFGVRFWERDVFIHVEGDDVLEGDSTLAVNLDQGLVGVEG